MQEQKNPSPVLISNPAALFPLSAFAPATGKSAGLQEPQEPSVLSRFNGTSSIKSKISLPGIKTRSLHHNCQPQSDMCDFLRHKYATFSQDKLFYPQRR